MLPYRYACTNLPAKYPNSNANVNMNITLETARYVTKATLSQFWSWATEGEKVGETDQKWERGCSFGRHLFSFTTNLKVPRVPTGRVANKHTHTTSHAQVGCKGGVGEPCAVPICLWISHELWHSCKWATSFCSGCPFSVSLHKLPMAQILINIPLPPTTIFPLQIQP